MGGFYDSLLATLKFDPAAMVGVWPFAFKVVLFCVPFLVLGWYLEKGVDGKARIPLARRVVKTLLFLAVVLPLFILGLLNLANTVRPALFAEGLGQTPLVQGLLVMEGIWPPVVLLSIVGLYSLLNLVEILRGDTSR